METVRGAIRWIDIEKPEKKDIAALRREFGFHPLILGELLQPSARPRVEAYKDYLFFVYHLSVFDPRKKSSRRSEIDFLVTRDAVITVQYGSLEAVAGFRKALDEDAALNKKALSHTGKFVYYLLDSLVRHSVRQLAHIEKNIEAIGADLFDDNEHEILRRISYVKRDILEYRIIAGSQTPLFESLKTAGEKFWGNPLRVYFETLAGAHLALVRLLETNRESLESFERTNAQIVNTNINRVMQKFAVLAFLTFPTMLAVSLFDMARPIYGNPTDAFLVIGGAGVVVCSMIAYFRSKGWL
ncbi:MAG: hypothetical protein HYS43_02185 [Candidatus Liptonbacteria bacterium]|nr:hypothetical protein [Candidatus Liptonbacteria bacterium]